MKIEKINQRHLKNDTFCQFHAEFKKLVNNQGADVLKIEPQFNDYLALYNKVDEGLKKVNKSVITEQIWEADKARDEIWYGILETNKTASRHFDPKVVEASKRLKVLFDSYGSGELAIKPINDQTSLTNNIMQELKSKYGADVVLVGIDKWATELKKRNDTLENLMEERFEESASKSDVVVKEARAELDKSYNTIIERLNALVIVEGITTYEAFIKTWNVIINKYKANLKRNVGAFGKTPLETNSPSTTGETTR